MIALWGGVVLQALVVGGLLNAGLFALPVLVLAAGWLLGLRTARWLALASMVVLAGLGWLIATGALTPAPPAPPLRYVITLCVLLGISYLTMRLLIQAHWRSTDALAELNRSLAASEAALRELNDGLERRVAERTEALARVQQELVESEKLSSLGKLVAGLAHELNTPLGIALSAGTAGQERLQRVEQALKDGSALKRSTLERDVAALSQGTEVLLQAIHRAADLVRNFKQVSADQVSGWRRSFDLATVLEELAAAVRPELRVARQRGAVLSLEVDCPPDLMLDSYPGALGQIVLNLVMNARLHAFAERETGRIVLRARPLAWADGQTGVELACEDDGAGIAEAVRRRLFEPFFTTRLGQGGTGLGLAVSRSLAMGLLGGRLTLDATHAPGSRFVLQLPLQAPLRREPDEPSRPEPGL